MFSNFFKQIRDIGGKFSHYIMSVSVDMDAKLAIISGDPEMASPKDYEEAYDNLILVLMERHPDWSEEKIASLPLRDVPKLLTVIIESQQMEREMKEMNK